MTRDTIRMDRRRFLVVSGALAGVEIDRSAVTERADGRRPVADAENLAAFAERLPAPSALAADAHLEVSLTQLEGSATTLRSPGVTDASAYATLLAGRTATDVAFGVDDARAVADRLDAEGYERVARQDGRPVFHRSGRTRHRVVALLDDAAVTSVGPRYAGVHEDATATISAVATGSDGGLADVSAFRAVLEHLGAGVHVSVDLAPDPRRAAESIEATGERYRIDPDGTAVRSVTLFDTAGRARRAGREDLDASPAIKGLDATETAIERRGRAVVRDVTMPPTTTTVPH